MSSVAMPEHTWVFRARLIRIVDGDTQDFSIDCAFHTYHLERVRLLGVDTPETHGETKAAGDAATEWVRGWYAQAVGEWPLVIETYKADSFGRYLGLVWRVVDGQCLNDDLLVSGHAVVR
jgi:micrococcal nuclease